MVVLLTYPENSCSSLAKSYLTLCNPMNCRMPDLAILHYLLEFAQTYVHWVSDAIQPSHLLLLLILWPSIFLSIRVFSKQTALHIRWKKYWTSASASVLPMNIQGWFPLRVTSLISLMFKGPSRVFSNTTVQKHQFFNGQLSLWCNSYFYTRLLEKP